MINLIGKTLCNKMGQKYVVVDQDNDNGYFFIQVNGEKKGYSIIVADLSLHYFDSNTTIKIMKEVKRVLTAHGILLARVNSINDINYGAGLGEKIEDNYYYVDGYNKRFFTFEDAQRFFSIVGEVTVTSAQMLRYSKPKELFEISAIVNK